MNEASEAMKAPRRPEIRYPVSTTEVSIGTWQFAILAIKPRREPIRTAAQERRFWPALFVPFYVAAHLGLHDTIDSLFGPLLCPVHPPLTNKEVG